MNDFNDLEEAVWRWCVCVAAVFMVLILCAVLDTPSETDAAAAVALDLNDAIQQARVAAKERP